MKYKCGNKQCFEMVSNIETKTEKHYDEHSAMHYDESGWYKVTYSLYVIEDCPVCGKEHKIQK